MGLVICWPYDSKVASCVADFWTRWINLPWYINILHPHGAILGGNTEWLSVAGGNSDWEARRNTKRQAGRELGRAEGCGIRHEENYDRGKGATL